MKIYFCLILFITISSSISLPKGGYLSNGGKIWALLVAGSNGYYNYRHQADICHAYQILHNNGIPDEQIIVMMYDDIANNSENPHQGEIINQPNGTNVYPGVLKDYVGSDVNSTNFLKVLKGDKEGMKNIGSGRVIESGPNDHIFVNFADHGAPGLLAFPSEELYADDLAETFLTMSDSKSFEKMLLYVEACESGSMFDNILPDNMQIMAVTAADPTESSYAVYYDSELQTFLGDVFSVKWMEDSDKENLLKESIHEQFEIVRHETNTSHVEEYGALDIGSSRLADFLGFQRHPRLSQTSETDEDESLEFIETVSSRDVYIEVLRKKRDKCREETKELCHHHQFQLHKAMKLRRHLELTVKNILRQAEPDNKKLERINNSRFPLTMNTFSCYKEISKHFNKQCFAFNQNSHALSQLYKFVNYCALGSKKKRIFEAMDSICPGINILDTIH